MAKHKSRRQIGARRYADYCQETLNVAVDLVSSKALSSYEAEKQFGIPRIVNRCSQRHEKPIGRPIEPSFIDEKHMAETVNIAAEFGTKHPERVLNSSKSSVSIMFSVMADGECLPPYVVYKAEHRSVVHLDHHKRGITERNLGGSI